MSSLPLLLYRDRAQGATITATNTVSGLGPDRMLDRRIGRVARFRPGSTVIDIDCQEAVTARCLWLSGLNPGRAFSGFTVFHVAAGTSAGGSDVAGLDAGQLLAGQASGVDATWRQAYADFGADVVARYWRVTLDAAPSLDLDIGRLYLGQALPEGAVATYPLDMGAETLDIVGVSESGFRTVQSRPRLRTRTINYIAPTGDGLDDLTRRAGLAAYAGRQVVWIENPQADGLEGARSGVRSAMLATLEAGGFSLKGVNNRTAVFNLLEVTAVTVPDFDATTALPGPMPENNAFTYTIPFSLA